MNCLFCKIINGEIPTNKVYEDKLVLAFLDVNPKSTGHTLIIPKKHYKDIDDIDDKMLHHILKVSKDIKKLLIEKLNCDGITYMQNNGLSQEVKHFHLHLVPNYEKDNKLSIEKVMNKLNEI